MFLNIEYNNNFYQLEFNGIKLFLTNSPNKFTKYFYLKSLNSEFSESNIFKNNVMIISDFTKANEFFNFSKNSSFFKSILDFLLSNNFLNMKIVDEIQRKINNQFMFDLIETKIDFNKVVNYLFSINDDEYLDKDIFISILESNLFDSRMTFILNDVDWMKIKDVSKYINSHNFIFVSNDFSKNICFINELELIVSVNKNLNEVLDSGKLISYLEKNLNIILNDKKIKELLMGCDNNLLNKINNFIMYI